MENMNLFPSYKKAKPRAGQLLIAEPLLNDPDFSRSVILLCEHGEEGTIGFVLNQPTQLTLNDLVQDLYATYLHIYQGGPVQADTMHMLHRAPQFITGSAEIAPNVYWGGSYEGLKQMVWSDDHNPADLRLFLGYSGWAPGQLEREIEEGTWLMIDATEELLFDTKPDEIWKKAVELLGKKYAYLANMPTDPQLN